MRKLILSIVAASLTFVFGLWLGSRVDVSDVEPMLSAVNIEATESTSSVTSSFTKGEPSDDLSDFEMPVFDQKDILTEALLLEEITLLKEDIQEFSGVEGLALESLAANKEPALSDDGYLGDALIDELALSSEQITQVNTVLRWAKKEVDTLSQAKENITHPKKNLYIIQNKEFRKDGKDIRKTMFATLSQEIGESKTQALFKRANKDFKNTFHNFGQSSQKTTVKVAPQNTGKKGVFIKKENTVYLSGNRTLQRIESGYYKEFPKRFEALLDVEF